MSGLYQPPFPYINGCHPPATAQNGQIYYDSSKQAMVVYDGSTWQSLEIPRPMLSFDAAQAIESVIANLAGQKSLHELADKYPLVASAIGQLEVALKMSQNTDNE